MEMESRTPKGRGKRRGAANTPVNDTRTLRKGRRGSSAQTFTAPPSPAKSEPSGGLKRKGRPTDIDLSAAEQRSSKRSRSGSQAPTPNSETPPTDAQGFIECPEPNCNKKYRNANGLKYHQSHAHSGSNLGDESKDEMDCEDIPLSVVKNTVKKEKDLKKESKKDKDKTESNDKKSEKSSENSCNKKNNKDDEGHKTDSKCDNNSKKKDKDSANSKTTVAQSNNSANTGKSQTSVLKSNASSPSSQIAVSSQGITSSVQSLPSQATTTLSSTLASSSTVSSVTVSPSNSVMQSTTQGDSFKAETPNKLVDIKPKITNENAQRVSKPNRPIVPAPTHTVLSNVQVTHSNLSPVMSHTQMSPQLKPIQPKPTIMGEPQNINPALADLNKDRKKVQKKKSKDGSQNGNTQQKSDQPTIKVERSGVIKTNPMPTSKAQSDQQKNPLSKDSVKTDAQRSHLAPYKGPENLAHSRPQQNPNLLKVGSPLQVNTPDRGPVSDDVQSPAYSDISDANESASPAAPSDSSPQKQKEEKKKDKTDGGSQPPPANTEGQAMPPYHGMYYYGQSSYGMNNMSPAQKGQSQTGSSLNSANNPQNQKSVTDNKGASTPNKDKQPTPEEASRGEKKSEPERDINRPKGVPPHMSGPPPNSMSPQQVQEYNNMMYQQMYLQSLPQHVQYQYMANGWYPPTMDPAYMRQMMDEQRRGERDGVPGLVKGPGEAGQDKGLPLVQGGPLRKDDISQKSVISPGQQSTGSDRSDSSKKYSDEKSAREQALRDKQNENHQILKENIELKNEMDKNKSSNRQAEEMRRMKMYQEQKLFEERKKMDLARKGESRPENLSKAPGTKPIVDHSARNMSSQRHPSDLSKDGIKRESINAESKIKDVRDNYSRDSSLNKYTDSSRPIDDKSKPPGGDKRRAETPTRNPDTPKSRPGGTSSKSGSPCSVSSVSIAGSPSYNAYSYNQYMQPPHFMSLEPMYRNPSVNPALMGGFSNSYIHPSQMGYRPPGDNEEKDRNPLKTNPPTSESDLKKGDSSSVGNYYPGNMHKIHELSEKGRPKSRNSSPVPGKPGDPNSRDFDKHREYTNSPPTQRHVHTHHHTHVLQPGPGLQPGAPLQGPPSFYPVNDPYSGEYS